MSFLKIWTYYDFKKSKWLNGSNNAFGSSPDWAALDWLADSLVMSLPVKIIAKKLSSVSCILIIIALWKAEGKSFARYNVRKKDCLLAPRIRIFMLLKYSIFKSSLLNNYKTDAINFFVKNVFKTSLKYMFQLDMYTHIYWDMNF